MSTCDYVGDVLLAMSWLELGKIWQNFVFSAKKEQSARSFTDSFSVSFTQLLNRIFAVFLTLFDTNFLFYSLSLKL